MSAQGLIEDGGRCGPAPRTCGSTLVGIGGRARSLKRVFWPSLIALGFVSVVVLNRHAHSGANAGRPVAVASATRGPLILDVVATGTVQPTDPIELRFDGEIGEVSALLVEPGQTVKRGQPIVRLARPLQPQSPAGRKEVERGTCDRESHRARPRQPAGEAR